MRPGRVVATPHTVLKYAGNTPYGETVVPWYKGVLVADKWFWTSPVGSHGNDLVVSGAEPLSELLGYLGLPGTGHTRQYYEPLCRETG